MQFFGGGKRSILEKTVTSSWRSPEEKDQLIAQLRESGLKPTEAIPLLWHTDTAARQLGVDSFLARPDVAAVNELLERMSEQPQHVRGYVTRLFARVPSDVMGKVVDDLLADKTSQKKRLGWEVALSVAGDLRVRYLERAVREAPLAVRIPALQRLLHDRPAEQLVDLLLVLARDHEPRVAAIALESLVTSPQGASRDARVLELVLDRLQNGDATSRELSRRWLTEAAGADPVGIRKRMMDLLGSGDDATRHVCVDILLASGPPEQVLMEVLLFCRNLVGWLRTRILETLRTFGDPILAPAVALLAHPEEEVRTAALVLAENFQDARLVEPICLLLSDPDWWLRITACDTLGRLKDERAVPHLVKALADEDCRWAAIDGLAQIGSNSSLKPLAGMLRDPRPEVRIEVIRAFSRFTEPRLLPLLEAVKEKDPSSEVRTRASEVLRDMEGRLDITVGEAEQGTSAVPSARLTRPIDKLLAQIREQGASDLHFTVEEPPFVRTGGKLERMSGIAALPAHTTRDALFSILTDKQSKVLEATGELDFCHAIPEVGRYRVNAFHQRRGWCASFRVIPNLPPTFADLRLPGRLTELLDYHQGLIIVSGPAGSGKSTTLAALVNLINETKADHIITLEDPIEFVHPVKSALVNQREVGTHTTSFARALRAALREDPDVIVVGEMRDPETIRLALTAAETGHLVIGTLHTTSAVATVDRMVKSFPPEEQPQVRMGLSESLKYVLSQSLLPRKDGKGRVAVYEVLKGTLPVGNLIRDNKTFQIPSMMQIGRSVGMQTIDVALADLVEAGLISPEAAWRRAERPETFEVMCDPSFLREKGMGG
ncbi:MAG: PilT/PilU family type 4a pilus ATPase [Pseudomonadota bacterium]|nr:PilT/PilU family type 4a pilus ATPase [Pseudomonadota bacterium]